MFTRDKQICVVDLFQFRFVSFINMRKRGKQCTLGKWLFLSGSSVSNRTCYIDILCILYWAMSKSCDCVQMYMNTLKILIIHVLVIIFSKCNTFWIWLTRETQNTNWTKRWNIGWHKKQTCNYWSLSILIRIWLVCINTWTDGLTQMHIHTLHSIVSFVYFFKTKCFVVNTM